jgi:integration host factor subunit beta
MRMTRSELVTSLVEAHPYLTIKGAEVLVDTIFGGIGQPLAQGDRVEIRGFGTFTTKSRVSRIGRNPRTGEPVPVAGKTVPFFKARRVLKGRVSGGRQPIKGSPGRTSKAARAIAMAIEAIEQRLIEISNVV